MLKRSKKFHQLKRVLISHRDKARERFHRRHRHIKRILEKHKLNIEDIRQKGVQIAATGAVAGVALITPITHSGQSISYAKGKEKDEKTTIEDEKRKANERKKFLTRFFSRFGPKTFKTVNNKDVSIDVESLFQHEDVLPRIKKVATELDLNNSGQYEAEISNLVKLQYGINSAPSLDSKRLNTYFGAIGQEQHMPRFPGDTASQHSDNSMVNAYGQTPGRSAWGYWTNSRSSLTQEMINQEKYYIAAQTFLAPGWRGNSNKLYNWFKHRKVLLVNPRNGSAVVAVIGDAGPATWTGKNFGGSPEVMQALDCVDGRGVKDIITGTGGAKDRVFVLFINDPNNKVPLGPVSSSNVLLAEK